MPARSRKPFLMRASSGVMAAVEKLAAAELRSVNAQVEVLLREALARRGLSIVETGAAEVGENDDSA